MFAIIVLWISLFLSIILALEIWTSKPLIFRIVLDWKKAFIKYWIFFLIISWIVLSLLGFSNLNLFILALSNVATNLMSSDKSSRSSLSSIFLLYIVLFISSLSSSKSDGNIISSLYLELINLGVKSLKNSPSLYNLIFKYCKCSPCDLFLLRFKNWLLK